MRISTAALASGTCAGERYVRSTMRRPAEDVRNVGAVAGLVSTVRPIALPAYCVRRGVAPGRRMMNVYVPAAPSCTRVTSRVRPRWLAAVARLNAGTASAVATAGSLLAGIDAAAPEPWAVTGQESPGFSHCR